MTTRLIIDIYCEIDTTDVGQQLELLEGDVKDPETGKLYKGTFIITDLEEMNAYDRNPASEAEL